MYIMQISNTANIMWKVFINPSRERLLTNKAILQSNCILVGITRHRDYTLWCNVTISFSRYYSYIFCVLMGIFVSQDRVPIHIL